MLNMLSAEYNCIAVCFSLIDCPLCEKTKQNKTSCVLWWATGRSFCLTVSINDVINILAVLSTWALFLAVEIGERSKKLGFWTSKTSEGSGTKEPKDRFLGSHVHKSHVYKSFIWCHSTPLWPKCSSSIWLSVTSTLWKYYDTLHLITDYSFCRNRAGTWFI